jgi:membrane-bound lytic murein transglycosylase F
MNKFISILVVLLCLGLFTNCYAGIADKLPVDRFSSKYDIYFNKYSKRYFSISTDYRWFKSQGMAESQLNPNAESPVHAKGIMQIMDFTRGDIDRRLGTKGNPFDARWSIQAGIWYDRQLYNQWKSKRTELNRLAVMFASYNAGLGNILKGQKACIVGGGDDCNNWSGIKRHGPDVKSWHHPETIGYVNRIFRFMGYNGW